MSPNGLAHLEARPGEGVHPFRFHRNSAGVVLSAAMSSRSVGIVVRYSVAVLRRTFVSKFERGPRRVRYTAHVALYTDHKSASRIARDSKGSHCTTTSPRETPAIR